MGGLQTKGGIPEVFRVTVTTAGRKHSFPFITNWMRIKITGDACKMYFTSADYDADENYVDLPNNESWPLELEAIWFKSVGSTDIEMVSTQRRG